MHLKQNQQLIILTFHLICMTISTYQSTNQERAKTSFVIFNEHRKINRRKISIIKKRILRIDKLFFIWTKKLQTTLIQSSPGIFLRKCLRRKYRMETMKEQLRVCSMNLDNFKLHHRISSHSNNKSLLTSLMGMKMGKH